MEKDVESVIDTDENQFYSKAKIYWSKVSPTINGVLGGFGHISECDINGSELFLKSLFQLKNPPGNGRALDCGAGIGRITKHLLIKHFQLVDLIDQNSDFVEKAKEYVSSDRLGKLYCNGLQCFKPEEKYDVIWCQWVLGHLTDEHFKQFMENCLESLNKNGVIVVKENITSSNEIDVDEEDSSITRPYDHLLKLFEESRLKCILKQQQTSFPKGLYPVKMFALRPV
uniref:Alpha N-terminal protein methyltransferase 1 n=1 Tax=Riptortus pedestris TaxID=329032 RepID=R4WDX2_RIPPE|nr:methyltransferase-like protein [Riptortus pedestris]